VTRTINGSESAKIFKIDVRPGWKEGTRLTYDGEGDQEPGRLAQDLAFVIKQRPHAIWRREGDDIVTKEAVSLREALCGFARTQRGVDGTDIQLEVADIVETGAERRVPGAGMLRKAGGRGDAVFKITVVQPSELTPEQKELIAKALPE
jgi:DnaJ-class molecular chaperone